MRGQLAWVFAPALLVSVYLAPAVPAEADDYSALIASPSGGHSGDTIYLAGTGLAPRQHFPYVLMACPNWHDESMLTYNNGVERSPGPTTDASGQFKGFPFQVPALHHWKGLGCQVYMRVGSNPYGPRFPATYTIYPPDGAVPRCLKHICFGVTAIPKRIHSGFAETVEIRSTPTAWPGAVVKVNVSYPGGKTPDRRLVLDVSGYARTQFRVTTRIAQPVLATVSAQAKLGGWGGSGTGSFTIEH